MVKVFAQYIADVPALRLHGVHHQVFQHGHTATATRACFGAFFKAVHGFATVIYGIADIALADTFATADHGVVGQAGDAGAAIPFATPCAQNHIFGVGRQNDAGLTGLQQHVVGRCITDQDATEKVLTVFANIDTLVNAFVAIFENNGAGLWGLNKRVAEGSHVHAYQFEFGAHVEAGEGF